jgi:molybdopterin molybdotransferase
MTSFSTPVGYAPNVKALLTVAEAQQRVLERVQPLGVELVPTSETAGRFASTDALAQVDLPPFDSSAMDGFAVRSADLPGSLPVVGEVAAGSPAGRAFAAGEAMAISTGGVVPACADAVVPIESVVQKDNTILVEAAPRPGANVRPRGGDVQRGDVVVPAGTRLRPASIGALSAAGAAEVECGRQPRVAVLTTGTELAQLGRPLEPGQVYEANGSMLAAAAAAACALTELLPAVADTDEAHRAALERGLQADVLVTSGGVSVGQHDLVRRIEAELGVEEVFWRVAVKPGRPVAFGVRGSTLVFGLPGNPVSALVGFELFVRPALLALQGASDPLPRFERGRLARSVQRNPARDEFLRARSRLDRGDDGQARELILEPLEGQESHMIGRSALADALILSPLGEGVLAAGELVDYLPLI